MLQLSDITSRLFSFIVAVAVPSLTFLSKYYTMVFYFDYRLEIYTYARYISSCTVHNPVPADTFFRTLFVETRHRWGILRRETRDTAAYRSAEQLFNEPVRTCIVSATRSHPQQSPPPPPLPSPSFTIRSDSPLPPPHSAPVRDPRGEDLAGLSCPVRCLRSFRSQSALFLGARAPSIIVSSPAIQMLSSTFVILVSRIKLFEIWPYRLAGF